MDIGNNPTAYAFQRFTGLRQAGFMQHASVRTPVVWIDGCPCLILGLLNTVETYVAPKTRDGYTRGAMLYHLSPLDLSDLAITPTRTADASPGFYNTMNATWKNQVATGEYCISAVAMSDGSARVYISYGSDHNWVACFDAYTGESIPVSTSTGSNWSGVFMVAPDNAANTYNAGTPANYQQAEDVTTKPVVVGDYQWRMSITVGGIRITRSQVGVSLPLWSKEYAGVLPITALVGGVGFIYFIGSNDRGFGLYGVDDQGTIYTPASYVNRPIPFAPRVIHLASTDDTLYYVESVAGAKLSLKVYGIRKRDGFRSVSTVTVNTPAPSASTFNVTTNNGILIVQTDVGSDHVVTAIRGDATPAIVVPTLRATGYVSHKPISFLPAGESVVVKPIRVANPSPADVNTAMKAPLYRPAFAFTKPAKPMRWFLCWTKLYRDVLGDDAQDDAVYSFPATWPVPSTRRNIPMPLATLIKVNVGKIGSNLCDMAAEVTDYVNAQAGEFGLCVGGVPIDKPEYYGKTQSIIDVGSVCLRGYEGPGSAPVPPVVPPVSPPLVDVTIKAADFVAKADQWRVDNDRLSTVAGSPPIFENPEATSPAVSYKQSLTAGKFKFTVHGWGPSLTSDSLWLRINGMNYQLASFAKTGSNISITADIPSGEWLISVSPREFGVAFDLIRVQQQV